MTCPPPDARLPWRYQLGAVLTGLVSVVLLVSAIAKLLDLAVFEAALRSWPLLPRSLIPALVPGVPVLELFLASLWLTGVERRWTGRLIVVWLGAGTLAYSVQLAAGATPSCGCGGAWLAKVPWLDRGGAVLGRNLLLLVIMGIGLWLCRAHTAADGPRNRPTARASAVAPSAFTLIELLVLIGALGILLALLAPALARVAARSRNAQSLGNLRSHAQVLSAYAADARGALPRFIPPLPGRHPVVSSLSGVRIDYFYFDAYISWNIALADSYYQGRAWDPSFRAPNAPASQRAIAISPTPDYLYPCVFVAAPDYWDMATRLAPPAQFRATAQHDVQFPANKSLLVSRYPWTDPAPGLSHFAQAAFIDGHAQDVYPEDMVRNHPFEGAVPDYSLMLCVWYPMLHCKNGVRGFDRAFGSN